MNFAVTVTFACLLAAVLGQDNSCSDADVIILVDESENARNAASPSWDEDPFVFVRDALREFLDDLPKCTLVGAYTYSSSNEQGAIIPEGSTAEQALQSLDKFGTMVNGGSWTERGLSRITSRPRSDCNRLVVVSTQGSAGNPARVDKAKAEADRVRGLGWNIEVIAVQGRNQLDEEELKYVNGNKKFAVLKDETSSDPKSFKLLGKKLKAIVKGLCSDK